MCRIGSPLALTLAGILVFLGSMTSANAQSFDIWVSDSGDDANDCESAAEPCRLIGAAIGKVLAGGVVHVLPGDYLAFAVSKQVEIVADDGQASIIGSAVSGASIRVTAGAGDRVRIRGLTLVGSAINASERIEFISGSTLHVEDCTLVNSTGGFGIRFAPTGAAELYVSNCSISGNGNASAGGGVRVRPSGSGSAKVVLDHVLIDNNQVGILVDGGNSSGGIVVNVRDSTISGSATQGIGVFEALSGATSTVVVERTTISSNAGQGIAASRELASVRVRQSAITSNAVGVQSLNGGQIISHGDNVLAGNTTNGAFTATLPPQ